MNLDTKYSDRYLIIYDDGRIGRGWQNGAVWTQDAGSPPVHLDHDVGEPVPQKNRSMPFDLDGQWPDTSHYDQNSPGILRRTADLDHRAYGSRNGFLSETSVKILVLGNERRQGERGIVG